MNVMVFDIETVPDVDGGRRVYGLDGLSDADVAQAMYQLRMAKTGGDFLAHHLHRIVAISVVFRHADQLKVWSLGDLDSDESELLRRFFDGLDRYTPTLVSWNGGGFDLPVIHYRALRHGVSAPRYWEVGEDDREFRFNNYLNRFHWLHTDLMDVLSGYQGRAVAPLDEVATLLGLPGKMGMSGAKVWDAYQAGDLASIRDYCETDVLNTYLVYLRFEYLRGHLGAEAYAAEQGRVRDLLGTAEAAHLQEFLKAWDANGAD
ncbi:3'-5' exonuclease [Acidihalobacter prosperus]|uniref:3'-5' exonuclease n=2 Tax=Acidihalobacter prosperus TaxID=160660 RepID=A0A1A6C770_9GAMM|nr:3'-5' exonuclease [Acidihalobacter prosperus]OBS10411.1 3'-5' exonuclease [Acidihalobacter prosperus]